MKKRIFCVMALTIFLSLAFSMSLLASNKNLNIAVITWRGETDGERGFKDGLKALGYTVQYTDWDAEQDKKELGRILRNKLRPHLEDFDYVYTFGTTISKITRALLKDQVPQLFNIVTDPVGSGIVKSLEAPGVNVGGATLAVPLVLQMEAARQIMQFERLGFLFNSREQNSMLVRKKLSAIGQQLNFDVVDLRSPPVLDVLQKNLRGLANGSIRVDAVYLPSDSFIISQAKLIGAALRDAKVKSIAATNAFVKNGALMGVVPDYYELGKGVAAVVDAHQRGKKLQNIPIVQVKQPVLVINKTTSTALKIDISEDILNKARIVE